MRAYRVEAIRRIEERAIAAQGVDALMQRAAAAVAASASDLLRTTTGGRYGRSRDDHGRSGQQRGRRIVRRRSAGPSWRTRDRREMPWQPHPGGRAALVAAGGCMVDLDDSITQLPCDLVIDGILGIGGRPGLPDQVAQLVASVENRNLPIVAVDLPSGVAADTGAAPGPSGTRDTNGHLW